MVGAMSLCVCLLQGVLLAVHHPRLFQLTAQAPGCCFQWLLAGCPHQCSWFLAASWCGPDELMAVQTFEPNLTGERVCAAYLMRASLLGAQAFNHGWITWADPCTSSNCLLHSTHRRHTSLSCNWCCESSSGSVLLENCCTTMQLPFGQLDDSWLLLSEGVGGFWCQHTCTTS